MAAPQERVGFSSVIDVLERRARQRGDQIAFTYTDAAGAVVRSDTYAALLARASAFGAAAAELGWTGERVLLLVSAPCDFVPAFLGCLYAGAVAVPLKVSGSAAGMRRIAGIVANCTPLGVMVDEASEAGYRAASTALAAAVPATQSVLRADVVPDVAAAPHPAALSGDTLAFLQYTSGSTDEPRGVMLSHGNLLANLGMIQDAFRVEPQSWIVSWLPLFHDMGLIGNVLGTLYFGASCVLMPPAAFARRPRLWLETITRYRAAVSGGPNFAFDLCARSVEDKDLAGLDLSSWNVAFTGAEPVRLDTLRAFSSRFARCGFQPGALQPTYGLAEATLFVTASAHRGGATALSLDRDRLALGAADPASAGERPSTTVVSCGRAAAETEVRIVDDAAQDVGEERVGEIWVRGPSVARGYWKATPAAAALFDGRLMRDIDRPFLRTGDLGFLRGGELFVVGRLKDLVIIGGRNVHPTDVEHAVAASHPCLRGQMSAAFGVERAGAETLVVIHEVSRGNWRLLAEGLASELLTSAQQAAAELEVALGDLVLVQTGRIPRTTSGKVRRGEARRLYMEGAMEGIVAGGPLPVEADGGDVERIEGVILDELARLLGQERSAMTGDAPLGALGVDSLTASRVAAHLSRIARGGVPLTLFYSCPTARALAVEIAARHRDAAAPAVPPLLAGRAPRDRPVRMTFAQERLWFLARLPGADRAYNLSALFELEGALNVPALQTALTQLCTLHDTLCARVVERDGDGYLELRDEAEIDFALHDLRHITGDALAREVEAHTAAEARHAYALKHDPPLRARVLRTAERRQLLLVTLPHLLADGWTVGLLTRELSVLYAAAVRGDTIPLTASPLRFVDYAGGLLRFDPSAICASVRGEAMPNKAVIAFAKKTRR